MSLTLPRSKNALAFALALALAAVALFSSIAPTGARAEDYEIRVIKNKYFTKRFRLQLDINAGGVMNQSFHNSYLGIAGLGFHFSESFGLHAEGGYSFVDNKDECDLLGRDFNINPLINEVQTIYGGYVSYTPIYGKYQLGSGDVLYFDWFFTAGGGLAANRERQGGCGGEEVTPGTDVWETTPQFNVGTGQRYFLGKSTAFIWNVRVLVFQPAAEGKNIIDDGIKNVILSLGLGYFL
jgi:outer membrane beta-barrel protein